MGHAAAGPPGGVGLLRASASVLHEATAVRKAPSAMQQSQEEGSEENNGWLFLPA